MAGRRFNSRADVVGRFTDALAFVDRIEPPADLERWVFIAGINAHEVPLPMRDIGQAEKDVREALDILAELDPPEDLRLTVADVALQKVSLREHLVTMPGQNREQRRALGN